MKKLNFKDGYEIISFDELKLSLDEKMISGKSVHGMSHVDVIDNVSNIINKRFIANIEDIYVSNSGPSKIPGVSVLPYVEQIKGEKSIEAHVFRRLITGFSIETGNDEWNTKIAISYHQNSIEIAIGANIKICNNLSIFNYDNYLSTKNIKLTHMFDIVSDWIYKHEEHIYFHENTINKLKNIEFSLDNCFQFIGLLTAIRVEKDSNTIKNYINDKNIYALNQGQISKFTENILSSLSISNNNTLSGYEVYNIGTNLHKPQSMEISNIISQNTEFSSIFLSFINENITSL